VWIWALGLRVKGLRSTVGELTIVGALIRELVGMSGSPREERGDQGLFTIVREDFVLF
jgi:hypothetical protein